MMRHTILLLAALGSTTLAGAQLSAQDPFKRVEQIRSRLPGGSGQQDPRPTRRPLPSATAAKPAQASAASSGPIPDQGIHKPVHAAHQSQTTEACMSEAEAKAGVRTMSSSMQQGDCTMQDFKQGGGTMSGTMVCKGNGGVGAPQMAMTGTYSPDKVTMVMTGAVTDNKLPGGKANLEMTLTSERTGDCAK